MFSFDSGDNKQTCPWLSEDSSQESSSSVFYKLTVVFQSQFFDKQEV